MSGEGGVPWYRSTYRWGQTNLTEVDPVRYDEGWWRAYWRRTRIQGVIVNAGGIVAYYPSRYPLHHRAEHLGDRDLYGEICAAAREEGLVVVARMDSNRADERFYVEHPDWFTVDAEGRPYRAGDLYVSCVNSPYYEEYLPGILEEVIERNHPEGFADNSWSGLPRENICHCENCARGFRDATGYALPEKKDWGSDAYRRWILWNYARRVEVWELNNRVTKAAGGPDCLWIGMNAGEIEVQSERFRDHKAICERTEIFFLDYQGRRDPRGFQGNADAGKLIHGLFGWDRLIPESTALYGQGQPTFRVGSKPEPEARLWALEGFAGGIQPWWHHIGAYHEDRRQYKTAEPLFRWHEENEEHLIDRKPLANVGVVWTQRNTDFYGQDEVEDRVTLPYRGVVNALIRARIPYVPVHADHVGRDAGRLDVLVLPNVGSLSDEQCADIRRFVEGGGGLVATGESSLYDEWGDRRGDFALSDLFGAHATGAHHGSAGAADPSWETWSKHSYLRISPELRAGVDGPATGDEPVVRDKRRPAFSGFEETDLLPFAGRIEVVGADPAAATSLAFVPPFPIFPPELSWMRHPTSGVPGLVLNESAGGRVAYAPADLDRCFGRDGHPDHARLLANLVRWAAGDAIPLSVEGPGLIDCHPYGQPGRLVLHLVNLTNAGAWPALLDELVPVGPLKARVRLPEGVDAGRVRLLVSGHETEGHVKDGWATIDIPSVTDHEVVVVE
ncbi:Tat pathway signal protein [Rubrobacter tropicus]|uniref:Tat pathway signal protein n=1 Tax=Rubrobacter tropicus TaxID=2653851 RepID=A0A6G8Q9Y8_9ACTN|nr:beta-galactosidase [Rubrobacter tropicus]QIN83286.1 Tat pathway signal protein [Rubrobacter tropicus]